MQMKENGSGGGVWALGAPLGYSKETLARKQ